MQKKTILVEDHVPVGQDFSCVYPFKNNWQESAILVAEDNVHDRLSFISGRLSFDSSWCFIFYMS